MQQGAGPAAVRGAAPDKTGKHKTGKRRTAGTASAVFAGARLPVPARRAHALAVLIAGLILMAISAPAFAASLSETVQRIKPAIVGVGGTDTDNYPNRKVFGTGFAVDNGRYVVTAAHAATYRDGSARPGLSVFVNRDHVPYAYPAKLVRVDRAHDVALLSVRGLNLPPVHLSRASVKEGDEVAFTGFPSAGRFGLYPVTHRGILSSIAPRSTVGVAMLSTGGAVRRSGARFDVYQLDAIALAGNSGSPVYDSRTGAVIGMVVSGVLSQTAAGASQPLGLTYAIPADHILRLIETAKSRE